MRVSEGPFAPRIQTRLLFLIMELQLCVEVCEQQEISSLSVDIKSLTVARRATFSINAENNSIHHKFFFLSNLLALKTRE